MSKYPELFDKLAVTTDTRTGWNRQELRNLAGENMLRVMAAVEKYRDDNVEKNEIEIKENLIPAAELKNTACRGETVPV